MYTPLIAAVNNEVPNLFTLHPDSIHDYLEQLWATGSTAWNLAAVNLNADDRPRGRHAANREEPNRRWPHLIYAYLIENTQAYEVFRRVVWEYTSGERLDAPSAAGQHWLRLTEALWYRHGRANSIISLESEVRPDARAIRRNAYYRMFGIDLNHAAADGRPYEYHKAEASNRDFVGTFEALLREIWVGIVNRSNAIGVNPTDDAAIAVHCERLYNMLTVRRQGWMLAREEFYAVAMMQWFHLTLNNNFPIIQDLRASASHPADRLAKVGERVGLPPHRHTFAYFEMALAASNVLVAIESGFFNNPAASQVWYAAGSVLATDAMTVITHWSAATGRDLKLPRAAVPTLQTAGPVITSAEPATGGRLLAEVGLNGH